MVFFYYKEYTGKDTTPMRPLHELKDIRLFLLDMDGTFYLDDHLLPGAAELLELEKAGNFSTLFLTNNSSRSTAAYVERLAKLGVNVPPEKILTSGEAAILWMQHQNWPRELLVIGTPSLEEQFTQAGYTLTDVAHAKAVVLGFDTTLTYAKLTDLCNALRAGLPYLATHPDFNCPVQGGYIPDIGAMIAFAKAATGREPDVVIGKPNGGIAQAAADRAGLPLEAIAMVGDRLYTDIALGKCGVRTVFVLSGEGTLEELPQYETQPDWIFDNMQGLVDALQAN